MWIYTNFKIFLFVIFLFYLFCFALVWFARIHLIYPFGKIYTTPANAGEDRLHERRIKTPDGETLIIWSHPANAQKPTFLYFHGNAGTLADRIDRFRFLLDQGYGVLALAYRGSSGSTGQPSEKTISQDAVLLRKNLIDLLGHKPNGKIIYYGESLGTGVAVKLAVLHPPDILILEAPYTSIVNLAAKRMPFFPIKPLLDQRWETETHIEKINVPTLIINSKTDTVIPYIHGQRVFERSPAKIKQLKTLDTGGHLPAFTPEGIETMLKFLQKTIKS